MSGETSLEETLYTMTMHCILKLTSFPFCMQKVAWLQFYCRCVCRSHGKEGTQAHGGQVPQDQLPWEWRGASSANSGPGPSPSWHVSVHVPHPLPPGHRTSPALELLHHCQWGQLGSELISPDYGELVPPLQTVFWQLLIHYCMLPSHSHTFSILRASLHVQTWPILLAMDLKTVLRTIFQWPQCSLSLSWEVSISGFRASKSYFLPSSSSTPHPSHLSPSPPRVHYKYRMVLALVVMFVLFVVTTAFVGIQTSSCESAVSQFLVLCETGPLFLQGWMLSLQWRLLLSLSSTVSETKSLFKRRGCLL